MKKWFLVAMMLLPIQFSVADESSEGEFKVLVVGAGVAGLGAAKKLADAGVAVTVVEARDRSGGRIWTKHSSEGNKFDMGAAWIHGAESNNNPIYAIAQSEEIELVNTNFTDEIVYDAEGKSGTYSSFMMLIEQLKFGIGVAFSLVFDRDASVEDVVSKVKKSIFSGGKQDDVQDLIMTKMEISFAADASDLSANLIEGAPLDPADNKAFPQGYNQITDYLAQGLDIQLNTIVEQIDYSGDQVVVTTSQGSFTADAVISTVSLGVLKSGAIEFSPSLPESKQEAIATYGYATLNKLYLQFPEVFWDSNDMIWQIHEPRQEWASWINIHNISGEPVILAFNAGSFAQTMEAESDEVLVAQAMNKLRGLYGEDIPAPVDFQISRWTTDPYAYGSYSYLPAGVSSNKRNTLAAPVDGKLFFAGEATSADMPSTVHGAYSSGVREADRILDLLM